MKMQFLKVLTYHCDFRIMLLFNGEKSEIKPNDFVWFVFEVAKFTRKNIPRNTRSDCCTNVLSLNYTSMFLFPQLLFDLLDILLLPYLIICIQSCPPQIHDIHSFIEIV